MFNTKIYYQIFTNDNLLVFPKSGRYSIPHWTGNDYPGPSLSKKENKFEDFAEAVINAKICLGEYDNIPKDWDGSKLLVAEDRGSGQYFIEIRKIEEKIITYALVDNCPCFLTISWAIAYAVTINLDNKIYRLFESEDDDCQYPNDDQYTSKFEVLDFFKIDDIQLIKILVHNVEMWTSCFKII